MSERALELLALKDNETQLVLDIGCGSGLSGEVITEMGHYWIGVDISEAMLSKFAWHDGILILLCITPSFEFICIRWKATLSSFFSRHNYLSVLSRFILVSLPYFAVIGTLRRLDLF